MFFLLAVWLLSLGTWSFQVIFQNHMGRRERGKGQSRLIHVHFYILSGHSISGRKIIRTESIPQNRERHTDTSVVTNYPGNYSNVGQSLMHRRNSRQCNGQVGNKQHWTLKMFIKVKEGFIQFYTRYFITRIKVCQLFHSYYHLSVTEYTLTSGEHKTTHVERTCSVSHRTESPELKEFFWAEFLKDLYCQAREVQIYHR